MIERDEIREGMVVRASDGKTVGRVVSCEDERFVVEKGFFFATEYTSRYDDVVAVSGDEIRLSVPRSELAHEARTTLHEGGLGESITLGFSGYLVVPPFEEDASWVRRGRARDDPAATHGGRGWRSADAPTYGEEGGGGLL